MVGNVTDAFRRKGMWDDMLMVMSTDNGGPIVRSLGFTSCLLRPRFHSADADCLL